MHECDGACHGGSLRQSGDGRKCLIAQDADQCREQVSADQVAGLGQRTLGHPVDENGGGPERADHKEVIGPHERILSEQRHRTDAQKGPEPRPKYLDHRHARWATTGGTPHLVQVLPQTSGGVGVYRCRSRRCRKRRLRQVHGRLHRFTRLY